MPELKSRQLIFTPQNVGVGATVFTDGVLIPPGARQLVFSAKADNASQLAAGTDMEFSVDGGATWQAISSFFTKSDNSIPLADLSVNWGQMAIVARNAAGTQIHFLPCTNMRLKIVNGGTQINNLRVYATVD